MKKTLTLAVSFVLFGSVLTPHAFASVKPGNKCSAQGQSKNWQGKKYTCVKSGKKLVWNKGVVGQKVTPTPTPSQTPQSTEPTPTSTPTAAPASINYVSPSEPSDSKELCKLIERNPRGLSAGFPLLPPQTTRKGTVKWALIPVDFKDLPGEKDFRSRVDNEMKLLSEWFDSTSDGKFKVEWVVADRWTTVPGVSSDYPLDKKTYVNNTPGGIKLFKEAMTAADSHFDFTNVQTVNFILPLNQNIANEGENGFPWDLHVKEMKTNEGYISSFSFAGKHQTRNDKSLWNYWVHEFGHAMGIPHVGSSGPDPAPFGFLEIMGDQDGSTREMSGWNRYLAEWWSDDRIYCKDLKNLNKVEITLVPLSSNESGIKLAIVPLTPQKALLLESRRATKFSCKTKEPRNGVLAYVLDLTMGHGQDFLVPIYPSPQKPIESATCNQERERNTSNPMLGEGEKLNFEGITVEVLMSRNFDQILVSKS